MIAQVVPITRLRRATDWWSYKLPADFTVLPGSLVVIPFRGRDTLGIVWDIEKEDRKATLSVSKVLTLYSLVHAPQRRFIEWLADEGICSLSTALHQWLPAALRKYPLTKPAQALLATQQALQAHPAAQQVVLTPGKRIQVSDALLKRAGAKFISFFSDVSDTEECKQWLAVASGQKTVGTGRERALFAPWLNMQQVIVQEPEDVSYYHEQIPYLNLVTAARALASYSQAELVIRTHVPHEAARVLWGPEAIGSQEALPQLIFTDLRREELLNAELITHIQTTLEKKERVLILYNANDRILEKDGERILLPGAQSLAKKLAFTLGYSTLPPLVIFGTRTILTESYENVGLTVVLSIDPLLHQEHFADQLHGWGDLGRLFSYQAPCHIQSHQFDHPLVQSLRNARFAEYCTQVVNDQKSQQLLPFAEAIVCSHPSEKTVKPTADALYTQLSGAVQPPWALSHPFATLVRKKEQQAILLHAPAGTRVPASIRKIVASLSRPWKVQRNPWFTV